MRIAKKPVLRKSLYLSKLPKKHSSTSIRVKSFTQNKISFSPLKNYFKYLKFVLIATLFLTWAGLMLFLPYFQITRVSYDGLKVVSAGEVDGVLQNNIFHKNRFLPSKNYFLVNTDKVKEVINSHFSLSYIDVKKVFPSELKISLHEKNSTIIYDNGEQYFLLDEAGSAARYLAEVEESEFVVQKTLVPNTSPIAVSNSSSTSSSSVLVTANSASTTPNSSTIDTVISSSTSSTLLNASSTPTYIIQRFHTPQYTKFKDMPDIGDLLIVYDSREKPVQEQQKNILSPKVIKSLIDFKDILYNNHFARVKYFLLNDEQDIQVFTEEKFYILFNPNLDLSTVSNNLKLILAENKPKEYINLRYDGRVYWK